MENGLNLPTRSGCAAKIKVLRGSGALPRAVFAIACATHVTSVARGGSGRISMDAAYSSCIDLLVYSL